MISVRPHPQRMGVGALADLVTTSDPDTLVVRVMEKMEWEREEHWFMEVSATFLQVDP